MSKIVKGAGIAGAGTLAGLTGTAFINGAYPNIEDADHLNELIRNQYSTNLNAANNALDFLHKDGHHLGATPQDYAQAEATQKNAQTLLDSLNTKSGQQTARTQYVDDLIKSQYAHNSTTLQTELSSKLDPVINQEYTQNFHIANSNLQGVIQSGEGGNNGLLQQAQATASTAQTNLASLDTAQGRAAARAEYLQQHAHDAHNPYVQLNNQYVHAQGQLGSLSTPQGRIDARNAFLEHHPQLHGALNSNGMPLLEAGAEQVRHDFDRITHDIGSEIGKRTPAQIGHDIAHATERAWDNTYDTVTHPGRTADAVGRRIEHGWDKVKDVKVSQLAGDVRRDADVVAHDIRRGTDNTVREIQHGVRILENEPSPQAKDDIRKFVDAAGRDIRTGADKVGDEVTKAADAIKDHPAEAGIFGALLLSVGGALGIVTKMRQKQEQQEMAKGGKGK